MSLGVILILVALLAPTTLRAETLLRMWLSSFCNLVLMVGPMLAVLYLTRSYL